MNKKILFLILLSVIFILPVMVQAEAATVGQMADNVKTLVVTIGGAIVVIGWVIAGILYLTAWGAPEKIGTAKKAMIAAIIGTVLVVFAAAGYDAIKTIINSVLESGQ